MRTILAVLAFVCTVLLGIIAIELYPIARVAGGLLTVSGPANETREQRNGRLRRETEEFGKDMDAILGWKRQTTAGPHQPILPESKTPTR